MKKKITSPFLRIAVLLLALVLVADVCVPGFAVFAEDNTSITGDAAAVEGDNTSIDGEDIVVLNDKQNPETPANPEEKQSEETPVNPEENGNQPEETPEEQPVSCQEGCEGEETCTVEGCTCACHLDNTSTDGEETPAEDAQNPDEAEDEGESEEENPDESEDEIPEEETADPVQELYDRLMACETLDEINAILYPETEEEQLAVDALIEQFTEEQNAALSAKMEELGAYMVDTLDENRSITISPGSSGTITVSGNVSWSKELTYTVTPNSSNITVTQTYTGYTITVGSDVDSGQYTVKVTYYTYRYSSYNGLNYTKHTDTVTVTVKAFGDENAIICYLKSPNYDPNTNETNIGDEEIWGRDLGNATVNMTGATWVQGTVKGTENAFNITDKVKSMPSELEKQDDGSWLLKDKNSTQWKGIFRAYKTQVESDLGGNVTITDSDVDAIYLVPYKISRNNGEGYGNPDKHVDCTIKIVCKSFYTAKFWVTKPGETEKMVDGKSYRKNQPVKKTDNAPTGTTGDYPSEIEIEDTTYAFSGWYNEAGWDSENKCPKDGAMPVTFDYSPSETELADGAVEFYAYYTPVKKEATITVKKVTTGNMAEYSREFDFTVSGSSVAASNKTFKLKNGEETTITVNIGDNIVITETDTAYVESYQIDDAESVTDNSATITNIQADTTIVFTNTLEATPDTGIALDIAPYIVLLATVAVGFVLMAGKKRYI